MVQPGFDDTVRGAFERTDDLIINALLDGVIRERLEVFESTVINAETTGLKDFETLNGYTPDGVAVYCDDGTLIHVGLNQNGERIATRTNLNDDMPDQCSSADIHCESWLDFSGIHKSRTTITTTPHNQHPHMHDANKTVEFNALDMARRSLEAEKASEYLVLQLDNWFYKPSGSLGRIPAHSWLELERQRNALIVRGAITERDSLFSTQSTAMAV